MQAVTFPIMCKMEVEDFLEISEVQCIILGAESSLHFCVFNNFFSGLFQSLYCSLFLAALLTFLVLCGSQESTAAPATTVLRNLEI